MTETQDTSGVELQGLEKSFRTPHGTVEAVRGVDIQKLGARNRSEAIAHAVEKGWL